MGNPLAPALAEFSKGASALLLATERNHSTRTPSLRNDLGANPPPNTNASVNRVSTVEDEKVSESRRRLLRLDSGANGDRNAPADADASVDPVSTEKEEEISKSTLALLPPNSGTNGDDKTPTPSARDAGSNAQAQTDASVNLVTMETLDDKHRLAIGDKLSFRIEEDKHRLAPGDKLTVRSEEEPTPLLVTDSGELEVPYIGRFRAENKTCKQVAYELKAALEKDYFYKATIILAVDLKTKSRGRVYLTGAVRVPGPQEIPSDEVLTLGKAILRAGGFTDFAERHNVKVTRKAEAGASENKTLIVDVAQVFDKGKTQRDLPLEPGDLILISERLIRF